jgi:hypothetical protein
MYRVSLNIILIGRADKAVTKVGYAAHLSTHEIIDPYALNICSTHPPSTSSGAQAFRFVYLITRTFSVSLA